jgi:hypothetical protein
MTAEHRGKEKKDYSKKQKSGYWRKIATGLFPLRISVKRNHQTGKLWRERLQSCL